METTNIPLLVHATHEAGVKLGGIGAVLDGLLGAQTYNTYVERTILVGPMEAGDAVFMERLESPRNGLSILYSSLHAVFDNVPETTRAALQAVEEQYQVALLYGKRAFGGFEHEVLLVDVTNPNMDLINNFKFDVWQHYGVDCARYSWNPEFNHYFTIALPLFYALEVICTEQDQHPQQRSQHPCIIAHEWLGMPVVFAAQIHKSDEWRSVFYAHETATARRIVEDHEGHDTRFYNVMAQAGTQKLSIETLFGDQDDLFKHAVLKQAVHCDNIFAVGDLVVSELRFMGGGLNEANIDLVYNGIPAQQITLVEKLESKRRLQVYCENLLGYVPDYVFTHVTRMVLSKAMWRDLRVMEHLDKLLAQTDKQAVLFVLSTSIPVGRTSEAVMGWERAYGWPVGHRADNGDLIGEEQSFFFQGVEPFNDKASNSKVVLVNQFGWSRDRCGLRMPEEMNFMDIRKGSDLEFGQSIYEPFGIAQVEPLSFGALCCVSDVCGCVGFVEKAAATTTSENSLPNVVVADYTTLPDSLEGTQSVSQAMAINRAMRDHIEGINSTQTAQIIFDRLPQSELDMQTLLEQGYETAKAMSWEEVSSEYLLPGVLKAISSEE
ncbi:MAG: hypothetical protein AAF639_19200 [Chloroflexota bacterium]